MSLRWGAGNPRRRSSDWPARIAEALATGLIVFVLVTLLIGEPQTW